jgi:integrase
MQQTNKLTVTQCRQITEPGYYNDGGGLYLRVAQSSDKGRVTKSWVFRYQIRDRVREMGLGALHTHSLAEARQLATEQRQLLWQQLDPLEERRKLQAARRPAQIERSFQWCAEQYIALRESGWRGDRHRSDWCASLATHVYPIIGKMSVTRIDDKHVMEVLEPIWKEIPVTAQRLRGRIEGVLGWAAAHKLRTEINPARWKNHMAVLLPAQETREPEHFAALPYREIHALFEELSRSDSVAAAPLMFAILACARSGEVRGAVWGEIHRADRMWIIPAERMKAHNEHRCALSSEALAILDRMWPLRRSDNGYIFPGLHGRKLHNSAMLQLLKKLRPGVTVHGCRASFETWSAEMTGYPAEVRDLALAHTVSDKVVQAYRRTDQFKRRIALAEDWANVCIHGVPEDADNIITLADRRQGGE